MLYILIGSILWGIVWGIVVCKVIKNKGYEEDELHHFVRTAQKEPLGYFPDFV